MITIPSPRGASAIPASRAGYPSSVCIQIGRITRLPYSTMPTHRHENDTHCVCPIRNTLRCTTGLRVSNSRTRKPAKKTTLKTASPRMNVRSEPIVLLAFVEHYLQCADPNREHSDAPTIDSAGNAANIRRIENETPHHEDGEHAHRDVDVEHPAPTVGFREPAAQYRPENRRNDDSESPKTHRFAAAFGRKCFEQDGL